MVEMQHHELLVVLLQLSDALRGVCCLLVLRLDCLMCVLCVGGEYAPIFVRKCICMVYIFVIYVYSS